MTRFFLILLLAMPALAQFGPHSFTNHNTLYVAPSGNDATAIIGRSDKPWATLTNAVTAAPNTGAVVRLSNGRFTLPLFYSNTVYGFSVNALAKTNLVIDGSGPATILYAPGIGNALNFTNCPGLVLRNFVIEGNKPEIFSGTYLTNGNVQAINLTGGTRDFLIQNVGIKNWPNHGINDVYDLGVSDGMVVNCWGVNVGYTNGPGSLPKDGAWCQITGPRWKVVNWRTTNCVRSVELWSDFRVIDAAEITSGNATAIAWQGIIGQSASSNCIVADNTIQGDAQYQAYPTESHGIFFTGNTEHLTISGNKVNRTGGHGIQVDISSSTRARFIRIINNNIDGTDWGIVLSSAGAGNTNNTLNLIAQNVTRGTTSGGIQIYGVNNKVVDNDVMNFGTRGIASYGSTFAGTNIWNVIERNGIFFGTTGIDMIDATTKTNYVRNNHIIGTTTHINDNGQGTVKSGNTPVN